MVSRQAQHICPSLTYVQTSRTFISSGRTACGICRGFDSQKPNYILLCDGCGFAAHQECYGVAIVPQENWYCDECKAWEILHSEGNTIPCHQIPFTPTPRILYPVSRISFD